MADIIDSFIVSLNLDPKQYNDEIKKFRAGVKADRDETVKSAKVTESANKSAAQGLRSLKNEALALFSVFTGARSLKDFAANILESDANTGRLAANLGVATKALSSWQMAVRTVGGSSGDADSSFQSLNDTLQNLVLRGDGSKTGLLGALGMTHGDLQDIPSAMLKISAASEHMSRQKFVSIAAALGISPAMINLLEKGRKGVDDIVRAQERNGAITEKDAIEAQKFQAAWANLTNFLTGQARPIITELAQDMTDAASRTGDAGAIAGAAAAGWKVLTDAIGAAVSKLREWTGLNKPDDDSDTEIEKRYLRAGQFWNAWLWQMHRFRKAHGMEDQPGQLPPPPPGSSTDAAPVPSGGSGGLRIVPSLVAAGFSTAQARGIAAGILAESRGDAQAINPKSGAYGIGQWLGSRKEELMRRYGSNPTGAQQMEFLIWELKGGDKGGPKVGRQLTADNALLSYIYNFMRPDAAGAVGDMSRGRAYLGGRHVASGGARTVTIGPVTVYTSSDNPRAVGEEVSKAIKERAAIVNSNSGLQ